MTIQGLCNKLEASLTDDARVIIYDHHTFIVQATGCLYNPQTGAPWGTTLVQVSSLTLKHETSLKNLLGINTNVFVLA